MKLHYFQINLNKYDERTRELEKKRREFISRVVIFSLIFAALFGGIVYFTFELEKEIRARQDKLQGIRAEIEALEQKETFVSRDDVLQLQDLEHKRILWAQKLSKLSRLVPQNMVLNNVYFRDDRMQIQGLSKIIDQEREFDRVVLFMDRIKSDPEFKAELENVRFVESSRVKIRNENLLNFTIACEFKKSKGMD